MICDNCTASKRIKDTMGCNGDQLHNRFEVLKSKIAKSFKNKYEPKFQCRFADLVEIEKQERNNI